MEERRRRKRAAHGAEGVGVGKAILLYTTYHLPQVRQCDVGLGGIMFADRRPSLLWRQVQVDCKLKGRDWAAQDQTSEQQLLVRSGKNAKE